MVFVAFCGRPVTQLLRQDCWHDDISPLLCVVRAWKLQYTRTIGEHGEGDRRIEKEKQSVLQPESTIWTAQSVWSKFLVHVLQCTTLSLLHVAECEHRWGHVRDFWSVRPRVKNGVYESFLCRIVVLAKTVRVAVRKSLCICPAVGVTMFRN